VGLVFINSQRTSTTTTVQVTPEVNELGTPIATVEGELPPGEDQALSDLPPMIEVVVSLQTVPRGWRITENEVTTDMRVASSVPSNVIFRSEDVIGKYARTDIYQGETFTFADIADDLTLIGAEDYGPSSLIPPGFIAAALPIDRLSSVAYGAEIGDYVDVMITFLFFEIDEEFQTYLPNAAILYGDQDLQTSDAPPILGDGITLLDPLGRFEELPTGELVYVSPSEDKRPVPISMILQNAKVIQVGAYEIVEGVPTPTPSPAPPAEGEATATPVPLSAATATPEPPQVIVLALQPQQQLFLKYAIESNADIDLALRGVNDGQLYEVENVDMNFFLERFKIEVPPNFNYSVDTEIVPINPDTP
jgi:Flp pilus assembly protein CpaB